jgi:hypothetical protein
MSVAERIERAEHLTGPAAGAEPGARKRGSKACQNQELLDLSHQILELTKAVHAMAARADSGAPTTKQR